MPATLVAMTNVRARAKRRWQYLDPFEDLAKLIERHHPRVACAVVQVIGETVLLSIGRLCCVHRRMGDLSTGVTLRVPRELTS